MATSDKDSGLISTDWKGFADETDQYRLRANLLVFEGAPGSVAVSYKSIAQVLSQGQWIELQVGDLFPDEQYRQFTAALDEFFLEVQRYVGPSVQQR